MNNPSVDQVAAALHDAWRETRRQPDGTIQPRVKLRADGSAVDIANTPFEDLPTAWQADNLAAAEHVLTWWRQNPNGTVEEAAAAVHQAWCSRHPDAAPGLLAPFEALPTEEQDKDRRIAVLARHAGQTQ